MFTLCFGSPCTYLFFMVDIFTHFFNSDFKKKYNYRVIQCKPCFLNCFKKNHNILWVILYLHRRRKVTRGDMRGEGVVKN